ncbi:MAG: hypothetical protein IKZ32_05340 [Alistipes sp.]|nr:hypothetical protein [Alistipes sp.]
MIRRLHRLWLLICAMVVALPGYAEVPTIEGRFSRDSVEVGDWVEYIIDIQTDRATEIGLPLFGENLTPEQQEAEAEAKRSMSTYTKYDEDIFELVEDYPIDTVAVDGRSLHLRKRYLLAVMETGDIPMRPAILYLDKNRDLPDTLWANDTILLSVARYMELDTTLFLKPDPTSSQGFAVDDQLANEMLRDDGLYSQKNLPFIFDEVRDYVTYGIIALILLALLVWLVVWLVRNYIRNRQSVVKPAPKLPPHVVAIKALEELEHRKLWQNGKHKLYYSTLTDILRLYIEGRWSITALEMTTDEIILALRDVEIVGDNRSKLIGILRTADMVKFAKAIPAPEQNEQAFTHSYYFVEDTKLQDVEHNEAKRDISFKTKIEE